MRALLSRSVGAVAVVVCLAAGGLAHPHAYHERSREIENQKQTLRDKIRSADTRAGALIQQLAESDARRQTLEARLASVNAQLALATRRLEEVIAELAIARGDLLAIEKTLARTLERLADAEELAGERIRTAYKRGPGVWIESLLAAESLRDLLGRLTFVRSVMSEDKSRIGDLDELSDRLEASRKRAAAKKNEIARRVRAVDAERDRIAGLRRDVDSNRQSILYEISNRRGLLAQVEAEKRRYLEAMARLEQESRSLRALIRSRQSGQVYIANRDLAWPLNGRVTSYYGYRDNPFGDGRDFHTGVDIAAPSGRPIVAAEAGEVIFAGLLRGYGWTVIVDHKGSLATLYAHNSRFATYEGAVVSRGQVVSYVGCSGWCTGPHVHYETRINGDPVDPMQFY